MRLNSGAIGNISATAGGSFSAGDISLQSFIDPQVTLQSGASLNVDAGGDLALTDESASFAAGVYNTGGHIVNGGNILVHSGGSIRGAANYQFTIRNANNGQIDTGGNIIVTAANNFLAQFGGATALMIDNTTGKIGTGGNISVTTGGNFQGTSLGALIDSRNGGSITSGGNIILALSGNLTSTGAASFIVAEDPEFQRLQVDGAAIPPTRIMINAASISAGSRFDAYYDDTLNNVISATGDAIAVVQVTGDITVSGVLNVLGNLSAGGNISVGTLSSTNVSTPNTLTVGAGGIRQFATLNGLSYPSQHSISAGSLVSLAGTSGGINFNGSDYSASHFATAGGYLTISANSLTLGSGGLSGPFTFNGGNSGGNNVAIGDGGTFSALTTGALTVSSPLEATTGSIPDSSAARGNGGNVTLQSSGDTVTVSSRIEVSSNDPSQSPSPTPAPPRRRSARGGNISLTSGKAGTAQARAVAVNVTSSSQLLSLLAAAPTPRPGGKITILATGANSDVNIAGKVQADGGTIDIRHQGTGGQVNISGTAGAAPNPAVLSADIIKAGAFGANGQLNIGNSTLSADSLLRLYADGSNGQVNFIANVTLSGNGLKEIAGDSVTINNNVIVTVVGPAASVYVNSVNGVPKANYTNWGGNGSTTGTFARPAGVGGAPANSPQPLASRPPFDGPIGRSGSDAGH